MDAVIAALKGALIVSCQAVPGEPLYGPHYMAAMASSAISGGARGVRANGPDDVAAIRAITLLPIIGIHKTQVQGHIIITPDFGMAQELAEAGADIIALDATAMRDTLSGGRLPTIPDLIARIH